MIQIKGSDTLINVVQKLAEVYMAKKPGTMIAVTGGGSGTGIAAMINKTCDIANASRDMKASEVEKAMAKGVDPKRVVVAIDGLSIVTNAQNPVKKLTIDQIGKIYRGEITNWADVGGENLPITLYGRQSNSGTYDFMKEVVMKGEYSSALKSMNGNAQIIEAIKQDKSGIGYVGVGYAKDASGITVLDVARNPALGYYSPLNSADVKSGKYPVSRPLNQYINGIPTGVVKDFLEFELSSEGQAIIEKEGFFAIPEEYQRYNDSTLGRSYEVSQPLAGKVRSVQGEYAK
ncbi:MAG: phosphate ABC transporter substrate-binding protein [Candidatus Omnitrophica bacterium]|nr:phosphate ABC transporter substrate-binding protein [Candidatus Omnitrophota bacterium]MCM8791106.1 phosphate ABC transporter substrate-binding protein [Candidatus Omnitrophota bacterium]